MADLGKRGNSHLLIFGPCSIWMTQDGRFYNLPVMRSTAILTRNVHGLKT